MSFDDAVDNLILAIFPNVTKEDLQMEEKKPWSIDFNGSTYTIGKGLAADSEGNFTKGCKTCPDGTKITMVVGESVEVFVENKADQKQYLAGKYSREEGKSRKTALLEVLLANSREADARNAQKRAEAEKAEEPAAEESKEEVGA